MEVLWLASSQFVSVEGSSVSLLLSEWNWLFEVKQHSSRKPWKKGRDRKKIIDLKTQEVDVITAIMSQIQRALNTPAIPSVPQYRVTD